MKFRINDEKYQLFFCNSTNSVPYGRALFCKSLMCSTEDVGEISLISNPQN